MKISLRSRLVVFAAVSVTTLLVAACSDGDPSSLTGRRDQEPGETPPAATPPPPTCSDLQKSYVGFSGIKLEAGRLERQVGNDRARLKSFRVLVDDYTRLLGKAPTVLAESGPTFGQPPARWYDEPKPGAVLLYQAYRVAFEACLEMTKTDPKYAVAPAAAEASAECAALQRKVWSRTPSPEEIQACVDVAVNDSLEETVPGGGKKATDPRRRWAYSCASVLAAPGFLTL